MAGKTEDSQEKYEIPHSYDAINWKLESTYKVKIGNIYDPSKFWVVHFAEELNLFFSYMNNFYNERYEEYIMPLESMKRGTNCAVYSNSGFYRAEIIEMANTCRAEDRILVFLFDFGYTSTVSPDNVYILNEKMLTVPKCAIRARLYGVEPYDTDTWSLQATEKFRELTQGKMLMSELYWYDDEDKTIYLRIVDVTQNIKRIDVAESLIGEKMAKVACIRSLKPMEQYIEKFVPKVKYPFLCPSFDLLENGSMPTTVHVTELLKKYMMTAKLFQPYYKCKGLDQ